MSRYNYAGKFYEVVNDPLIIETLQCSPDVNTLQIICTLWEHAKPVSHFVPVPCMFIEQVLVVTAKTCLFHYTGINACCGNMHVPVLLGF